MTGHQLAQYRKGKNRTQVQAARALGVSQTYLSLLEAGKRPLTAQLRKKAAGYLGLSPAEVPARLDAKPMTDDQLASDLATLGYLGFSHLKRSRPKNPADVLLSALNAPKRDARLVEALPWVVLAYPNMEWNELVLTAKMYDLQNRLGFVVSVAREFAESRQDMATVANLKAREAELERSMLAREDTLCNETMTNAERRWLAVNRPPNAKHWRLLTDLSPRYLSHYG